MNYNILWLIILSALFGLTSKYADLINEHGVKPVFREKPILSGIIWGVIGGATMLLSPLTGVTYVAHILYWYLRVKLEYANHAIAGVIILLTAFVLQGEFYLEHRYGLLMVFLGYAVTGYIQTYLRNRFPVTKPFWRLRLRIYLVPFAYAYYHGDIGVVIATCCGMLTCEYLTIRYQDKAEYQTA